MFQLCFKIAYVTHIVYVTIAKARLPDYCNGDIYMMMTVIFTLISEIMSSKFYK